MDEQMTCNCVCHSTYSSRPECEHCNGDNDVTRKLIVNALRTRATSSVVEGPERDLFRDAADLIEKLLKHTDGCPYTNMEWWAPYVE